MDEKVLVVSSHKQLCYDLCELLKQENYHPIPLFSMHSLYENRKDLEYRVIVLDLDNSPVDNQLIKNLRRWNPRLPIVCLSSRPYHPELKEALTQHVYACLKKPVDQEEFLYWIKCLTTEDKESSIQIMRRNSKKNKYPNSYY